MRSTVVEYAVTTGANVSPEEASEGLFPGCRVVWIGEDRFGRTVTYYYLVDAEQPLHP